MPRLTRISRVLRDAANSGAATPPVPGRESDSKQQGQWLVILAAFLLAAGMWMYYDGVLKPSQAAGRALKNVDGGNFSDVYPAWLGTRELLLHGRDPYNAGITADIQKGFYGRLLDPTNPNDVTDEERFAYPLFIIFLLAPTVVVPFRWVQLLYPILAAGLSIGSVWCWLRAFEERRSETAFLVGSILWLSSVPVVWALHLQQLTLIVAPLIAAAMAAGAAGSLWAAGALLAFAMIKPQITAPVAAWLLLWAVCNWRERRGLFFSFSTTIAALIAGAEVLVPGWIWKWSAGLRDYVQYGGYPQPQVHLLFGKYIGSAVGVALVVGIVVFCWRARRNSATSERFMLVTPFILAAGLILSPIWHMYDDVLILPAVLLGFHWRDEYFHLKPFGRGVIVFSIFVLAWSWTSAIVLYVVSWVSPISAPTLVFLPFYSLAFSPVCAAASLILLARERLSRAGPDRSIPDASY